MKLLIGIIILNTIVLGAAAPAPALPDLDKSVGHSFRVSVLFDQAFPSYPHFVLSSMTFRALLRQSGVRQ
ncbi:hypothetical protein DL96DRAFT_1625042 [Flagelloscypha sp. PMI_526]|nr:hypothetical protein DL96DRAFT_1625042 [Flagelloscypha sp. PMI_526]